MSSVAGCCMSGFTGCCSGGCPRLCPSICFRLCSSTGAPGSYGSYCSACTKSGDGNASTEHCTTSIGGNLLPSSINLSLGVSIRIHQNRHLLSIIVQRFSKRSRTVHNKDSCGCGNRRGQW